MLLLVAAAATAFSALRPPPPLSSAEVAMRKSHQIGRLPEVMQDLFRPVATETPPAQARLLQGALPADLPRGAILKNGPNAQPDFDGSGGWLDGDGLVHCCVLPPDGHAPRFSRTWIRTAGFSKEEAAGKRLFDGALVAPQGARLLFNLALNAFRAAQPQKDTANTALLALPGGRCLALMEQCLPSELRVAKDASVHTLAAEKSFDGQLLDRGRFPFSGGALTAHFKRDPATGESIGVTYVSSGPAGTLLHVIDGDGSLARPPRFVPLPGPAQVMVHDCAITAGSSGHVVLLDLPLTIRPIRMLGDKFPVEYEPEHGARIGLLRRDASPKEDEEPEVAWVEVEPCVVLHTMNAHERPDGTVVLTALRSEPRSPQSFIQSYTTALLHRWVLDPATGRCVAEEPLSDVPVEFPTLDPRLVGSGAHRCSGPLGPLGAPKLTCAALRSAIEPAACTDARYGYAIRPGTIGGPNRWGPPFEGILIDGVIKYDLRTGELAAQWTAPPGWWVVSEATFIPKTGSAAGDGDSGYLLVFACRSAVPCAEELKELPHRASDVVSDEPAAEDVDAADGRASRLYVLDAATMEPAATLALPGAVPYGLHSVWLPYEELAAGVKISQ